MAYDRNMARGSGSGGSYGGKGKRTLAVYLGFLALLAGLVAYQARSVLFYPATARSRVSAAAADDAVYLVGGISARGEYLADVLRVDTASLRMRRVAKLPAAMIGCEAVAVDGELFVLGGYTGRETLDSISRLDRSASRLEGLGPLPGPRAFGAAVAVGKNIAYLGGWDGERVLDEIVVVDTSTGRVTTRGRLPSPRQLAAAALFDGRILLLGGEDEQGQPCPDLVELDPTTFLVLRSAPLVAPPLHPRLAVLGGQLLCYDGFAEDQREALAIFEPASLRMTPILRRPLPARDLNLALAAGADALFLVGGTDTDNPRQPSFLRVLPPSRGGSSPFAEVTALHLRSFLLLR